MLANLWGNGMQLKLARHAQSWTVKGVLVPQRPSSSKGIELFFNKTVFTPTLGGN